MAWALQFDGVNDYTSMPSLVTLSGNFEVEVKFRVAAGASASINVLRTESGQNQWIGRWNGNHILYWGGNIQTLSALSDDVDYTYVITRTSNSVDWRVNGTLEKTFTNASDLILRDIFRTSAGRIEYLKITDNSTLISHLDATASNHGTGTPILVDIVGTNDATGVNMPTDGSAWLNLGGSPVTTPLTLSYSATPVSNLDTASEYSLLVAYSASASSSLSKLINKGLSYVGIASSNISKEISTTKSYNATGTSTEEEAIVTEVTVSTTATGLLTALATFIPKGVGVAVKYIRRIGIKIGIGL